MSEGRVQTRLSQALFGQPSDRTRGNGQKLNHMRFCLNIRKYFFLLVRLIQCWLPREGGVPILGDIEKLLGCGPVQPTLGVPTWAVVLDKNVQPQPFSVIPWNKFYNSCLKIILKDSWRQQLLPMVVNGTDWKEEYN